MKKILSLMLLCAAMVFASCGKDDDSTSVSVSSVTLDKTTLSIEVGETSTLTATVAPENAMDKNVTWASDKTDIATVKDGVVTAVKAGMATITVTSVADATKKATCTVTVEAPITVNGMKWAAGNLVADGANGAKIGLPTDGGLWFQFGSIIGWSATNSPEIVVKPVDYTGSTTWNQDWTGDSTTDNAITGTGDPCRYYLKGTWRLPTKDEYEALFNYVTDDSYASYGGWSWDATAKSATHTGGLTFPSSGYYQQKDPTIIFVPAGTSGFYWSSSVWTEGTGYALRFNSSSFTSSGLYPIFIISRALGMPVRCVQNASN